jgi:hypothetical protein
MFSYGMKGIDVKYIIPLMVKVKLTLEQAMKSHRRKRSTADPRVTTGLTYEQLGLRPTF